MTISRQGNPATPSARRVRRLAKAVLLAAVLIGAVLPGSLRAAEPCGYGNFYKPLNDYIEKSKKLFDVPGLAIAVVKDNIVPYACGFGVRTKRESKNDLVTADTVFQIGSTTKAFLATTMAIMVDKKKMGWHDKVTVHDPRFKLQDLEATEKFEMADLLAQRSGLPEYSGDMVLLLGASEKQTIASLFDVKPASKFPTTYSYTNIPQLEAGRIIAELDALSDWNAVLQKELLTPLQMKNTSFTDERIANAPNHAEGHIWWLAQNASRTATVPFTPKFPYRFGGAGDINSTAMDLANWLKLQMHDGRCDDKQIVSKESLDFTHVAEVRINDNQFYALGWIESSTPNGTIIWHKGTTYGFGSFVGWWLGTKTGIVILTNEADRGFPSALGLWALDWLITGKNPPDYVQEAFDRAVDDYKNEVKHYTRPEHPQPPPLDGFNGLYSNPSFGGASLGRDGEALIVNLEIGAELKLEPFDGDLFTMRLQPTPDFAALAEDLQPFPLGFARVYVKDGHNHFELRFADGPPYDFIQR
jgi:CubicO group peptidase (beta-lactamase class C family)